jgi:ribosomal protein S18 acetylase RimI-like enzyme
MSRSEEFKTGKSEHKYFMAYQPNQFRWDSPYSIVVGFAEGENKQALANMNWGEDGEIKEIWVHPEHRRQGLATRMYNMGKRIAATDPTIPEPVHSTERRSELGDLWSRSTPDHTELPKSKIKKRLSGWRANGGSWD